MKRFSIPAPSLSQRVEAALNGPKDNAAETAWANKRIKDALATIEKITEIQSPRKTARKQQYGISNACLILINVIWPRRIKLLL